MNRPQFFISLFIIALLVSSSFAQKVTSEDYIREYKAGNFESSLTRSREAIKTEPSNWLHYYYAGLSLISLDKEKDAVKMLQKAVELNQTNAAVRAALAYGYLLRNDKKATDEATAALKLDKKNADANYVLAAMAIRNESYNTAYERSKAAIASEPKLAAAYFTKSQSLVSSFIKQRGTVLKNESRSEMLNEAAADLEQYIRLQPQSKNVHFYKNYVESLRFFAEYYSRSDVKLPDVDATAEKVEPNKTPLKVTYKQKAQYTDKAKQAGVQGTLTLLVGFASDGTIEHVLLLKPLGYGLDEQAVAAARAMKFEPETVDGKPVSTVRPVSYTFNIR